MTSLVLATTIVSGSSQSQQRRVDPRRCSKRSPNTDLFQCRRQLLSGPPARNAHNHRRRARPPTETCNIAGTTRDGLPVTPSGLHSSILQRTCSRGSRKKRNMEYVIRRNQDVANDVLCTAAGGSKMCIQYSECVQVVKQEWLCGSPRR